MKIFKLIVCIVTLINCFVYFTSSDEKIQNIAFIFEMIGVAIQIFVV